jgi:hypothetical protein
MYILRHATAILLLALAACGSPHDRDAGSPPLRAAAPPADYIYIGSGDASDDKNIQVGVNTALFGGDKADEGLSVMFGFYFSAAVHDAQPAEFGTVGDGLSVSNPIVFSPPVEASAELQSAINLVAKRSPDRHNVVGSLYRNSDRRYLLLVEFDNAAGANAIYFDVTKWAKAKAEAH